MIQGPVLGKNSFRETNRLDIHFYFVSCGEAIKLFQYLASIDEDIMVLWNNRKKDLGPLRESRNELEHQEKRFADLGREYIERTGTARDQKYLVDGTEYDYSDSGLRNLTSSYEELIQILKTKRQNVEQGELKGLQFYSLSDDEKVSVLPMTSYPLGTSLGFGSGVGKKFDKLETKYKDKLFEISKKQREFAKGLVFGLSQIYETLDVSDKSKIVEIAKSDSKIAWRLGFVGLRFSNLTKSDQEQFIEIAVLDSAFAETFAFSISRDFSSLEENSKVMILELCKTSPKFADEFTRNTIFTRLSDQDQDLLFEIARDNDNFAYGLGLSIERFGFWRFNELKAKIEEFAKTNSEFANGLARLRRHKCFFCARPIKQDRGFYLRCWFCNHEFCDVHKTAQSHKCEHLRGKNKS
jgi:hypothetical protein